MQKKDIYYFDTPGKHNTNELTQIVAERVAKGDIKHIVVATSKGDTAELLHETLKEYDVKIVAVGLHYGFNGADNQRMTAETKQRLEKNGVDVCFGSHSLSGVGRSISKKFGGATPVEIIAHTLRIFCGHGVKVAVEVAIMAADAGFVPTQSNIIAIGGTSGGSDTAIVMKAAHMNNFFDMEIGEILAKPITTNINDR